MLSAMGTGSALAEEPGDGPGAPADPTREEDEAAPGCAEKKGGSQDACSDDDDEFSWKMPNRHGMAVLGGFGTPNSTFGGEGGLVVGSQSYGGQRNYGVSISQVEIGNGLGGMVQGFRTWNALELDAAVSPVLGVNPLELDVDANTNEQSHDYFSWTAHADAGLRVGDPRSCFGAATTGAGVNSGTQSLGPGDWFRLETNLHASGVCGPVTLGLSLRNIDDDRGTVAQALASAALFVDERHRFGFGAALAVTGYAEGGAYSSVYEAPFGAFDGDIRQTMLRITFVYRDAEKSRRKWVPAPEPDEDAPKRPPPLPGERASAEPSAAGR
jgi:hypothetical protein